MKNSLLLQNKGAFYIILSSIFFGSYGIWSKLMADSFGAFFQSWVRGLLVVLILGMIGIATRQFRKIDRADLKWFALVSVPGSLVFPLYFIGFLDLSIGTATILFYAALTLTTYVLGYVFFKEQVGPVKMVSLILGVIGVLAIYKFSIADGQWFSAIFAALAGICGGIEVVFTKKLSDKYSPLQLTSVLYLTDFVLNLLLFMLIRDQSLAGLADTTAWFGLVMFALAGICSFWFVVKGYKTIEPSVGGILGLLEIIFGVIFGVVLFGEVVAVSTLIGGGLILVAALLPNLRAE